MLCNLHVGYVTIRRYMYDGYVEYGNICLYYYIANIEIGLVVENIIIMWYDNLEDLTFGNW